MADGGRSIWLRIAILPGPESRAGDPAAARSSTTRRKRVDGEDAIGVELVGGGMLLLAIKRA
jgi:hypothetical protein